MTTIRLTLAFVAGLTVILLLADTPPQAGNVREWTGQATLIDADTLEISGVRFRLHGIDAPESAQSCRHPERGDWPCGQTATEALSDRINGAAVTCRETGKGIYQRIIAVCSVQGADLNRWLVRSGQAVAYVKYARDYAGDEAVARRAGIGIWSGAFIMPSDWRRGVRPDDAIALVALAAPGCRIKGNISRYGKIYHLPGTRWYARTKIDTEKGERWFCSEAEAESAGWRKAG